MAIKDMAKKIGPPRSTAARVAAPEGDFCLGAARRQKKPDIAKNEAGLVSDAVFSCISKAPASLKQIGAKGSLAHRRVPAQPNETPLNSASSPSTRKNSADTRCTILIGTSRVMRSPSQTTGAFASIMPKVVPATTP